MRLMSPQGGPTGGCGPTIILALLVLFALAYLVGKSL